MMRPFGYEIIEYSNEGSESEAHRHEVMLSQDEVRQFFPEPTVNYAANAVIGTPGWTLFNARLTEALKKHVRAGDIIAHPFGRSHAGLVRTFPQAVHVETGVGYNDDPFGAWRIFESEAWRHYHWGKGEGRFTDEPGMNRYYSWVIPNFYDPADWPVSDEKGHYVLFMGRIIEPKGILTLADIIQEWDHRHPNDGLVFKFAGTGDITPVRMRLGESLFAKRVVHLGPVTGKDRAALTGQARCLLMPTVFIEPFGGSGVESMLTGTPLIASDWGAFTETVFDGLTGYRCKVLNDWIKAIERAPFLDRAYIAEHARVRYSLEACGKKYDQAFKQLGDLQHAGWYTRH